jgi:hypothetical protein
MSAAAVVFVAIAIAKPWGESAPSPGASSATPSLVAEIAKSSTESAPLPGASAATPSLVAETAQPVVIVVQAGEVPTTLTVVCTEDPRVSPWVVGSAAPTIMGTQIGIVVDPSGASYFIAEPVTGLLRITQVLVCTGANLQGLESVLPSPSVP